MAPSQPTFEYLKGDFMQLSSTTIFVTALETGFGCIYEYWQFGLLQAYIISNALQTPQIDFTKQAKTSSPKGVYLRALAVSFHFESGYPQMTFPT